MKDAPGMINHGTASELAMTADKNTSQDLIFDGPALLSLADDGVAELTLNTPETANCLNSEMLTAISAALAECNQQSSLRALILKGAGKNFCAGGDIKTFIQKGDALPEYIREATTQLACVVSAMIQLPVPVIASVQGYAAGGGGFGFVCAADFVVAADSANFLAGATRVGMAPDAGLSVTLQNLVGFRRAMNILLTNPTINAQEAEQMGLVTMVVPVHELDVKTHALAADLAEGAPLALAETKRLLWNSMGASVEDVLDDESRTVAALSGSNDCMEAMNAILEKRSARFDGN